MPERLPSPRRVLPSPGARRALGGLSAALTLLLGPPAALARADDASDTPQIPPAALAACPGLTAPTSEVSADRAAVLVLCAINAERQQAGVAALQPVGELAVAAQGHTREMVAHGDLEHGDLPTQLRGYARGYGYQLGENVGETTGDAAVGEMIGAWMASGGHRANILDPRFHDVGIGVLLTAADGGPGATYTTDFGSRRPLATRRAKARRRAVVVRRRHRTSPPRFT